MRVYVGQTRDRALIRRLWLLGYGECTQRGQLPPARWPWVFDNLAWSDSQHGRQFDAEQFSADLHNIYVALNRPDFIVLPDIVAGGLESLAFSRSWLSRCRGLAPLYLAVQDGMQPEHIEPWLWHIAGVFIGGSLEWKVRTGAQWVEFAHEHDIRCHVGRCGGMNRVRWARRIGADSIDSCLPLFSVNDRPGRRSNLSRFRDALENDGPQIKLPLEVAA